MLYDLLAAPFVDYQFMRRALVGALALALAGSPLGVFLVLRRMSLAGDALARIFAHRGERRSRAGRGFGHADDIV